VLLWKQYNAQLLAHLSSTPIVGRGTSRGLTVFVDYFRWKKSSLFATFPWARSLPHHGIYSVLIALLESTSNVMAHDDARQGKWRGNWRMQWGASTLHTTSEHGVSSITIADAHTSAASSRLNLRPLPI